MSGLVGGAGSRSGIIGQTELEIEEGEYNPTFSYVTGSATVASGQDTLQYTKHGTVVFIHGNINFSAVNSPARLHISIPFTARSSSENSDVYSGGVGSYNAPFGSSKTQLIWRINGNDTNMGIYGCQNDSVYSYAPPDANSEYFFCVTYLTDA